MRGKLGQVNPYILIIVIIIGLLLVNQATQTKYVEIDLKQYSDCSDINPTVKQKTTIGWTNSGRINEVYYMTFGNSNDIIEIKGDESYKLNLVETGTFKYKCGTNRYSLKDGSITVKPWYYFS